MQNKSDLVGFTCVGRQRICSSWLVGALREQSSISLPKVTKETFFRDKRCVPGPQGYIKHFKNRDDGHVTGISSADSRIAEDSYGKSKLIVEDYFTKKSIASA
jgi:hypothetical protein